MRRSILALAAIVLLSGCGSSTGDRAASGAGIGAAAGTLVGAVTGLSLVEGALIGAAAGGLTGGLTDQDTINLGEPIWAEKTSNSDTASNQASLNLTSDVQSGLTKLGYDPGPVDGQYGPKTQAAIESYQADNGLLTDGLVTSELAAHIGERVAQQG